MIVRRGQAFVVEHRRCVVELNVGRVELGARPEERPRLGDVGAQRARAVPLEALEVLGCERTEERRLVGLVVELRHQVVLQVVADGQVLAHFDPEELQVGRGPDPRQHQQDG